MPVASVEDADTPPVTINKNLKKILARFSLLIYPGDTERFKERNDLLGGLTRLGFLRVLTGKP